MPNLLPVDVQLVRRILVRGRRGSRTKQQLVDVNSQTRLTDCAAISVGISEVPLRFRAGWALFPSKHTLGISKIRQGTDPGDRGCGVAWLLPSPSPSPSLLPSQEAVTYEPVISLR